MALNRIIHDLQDRQKVLIQSRKLQAVGTLTAGVTHELNNPINTIMLTANMLLYKDLYDKARLRNGKKPRWPSRALETHHDHLPTAQIPADIFLSYYSSVLLSFQRIR
ncbi:MAG: hypothetical protein OS130_03355 [Thermodesulfobacteriota bacterium]|nr:MAG: hypothetical protein OS130_03355 [Thermodesulfobacteriota bacterium]